MTKKISNLSLAAILGLGACAGQNHSFTPFYPSFRNELGPGITDSPRGSKPKDPKLIRGNSNSGSYSQLAPAELYGMPIEQEEGLERSYLDASFESLIKNLPLQIVDRSTSVDLGVARVAASGDSVLVRPLYSSVHTYTLDKELYVQKNDSLSYYPIPNYFDESFVAFDDPERIKRDEGIVVSSLLRWVWDWDLFTPLRNTANNVRAYSNEVVKDTLGSNSEFDYTGRRIILGYNLPIGDFYLECCAWAEVTDPDRNGFAIQMAIPFGRRN